MKNFLIAICFVLCPLFFFGQQTEYVYPDTSHTGTEEFPVLVNFHEGNLASAIAKAKREAKLVFVDFYADWCGPCKLIEKEIFTDHQFADYVNQNFVAIKLHIDQGFEGLDFATKMSVSEYPTALVINTGKKEIGRIAGYKTLNSYLLELKRLESYSAYQR